MDQIELILADFLGAELIGGATEVLAEFIDVIGVGIDRGLGQIANQHVFRHALREWRETFAKGSHEYLEGTERWKGTQRCTYYLPQHGHNSPPSASQ